MDYEAAQQWDKAAQEFTLAVAADPSNMEYQLHFRRASFNASQSLHAAGTSRSRSSAIIVGAYNAFRQAYGYDPVNELAVSEMERMLRLQSVKEGTNGSAATVTDRRMARCRKRHPRHRRTARHRSRQCRLRERTAARHQLQRDLKAFIRSLAEQLQSQCHFRPTVVCPTANDRYQSCATSRRRRLSITSFLQEGLFFQKLSRRTILVADQTRRPQYQQLVLRTFFLSNMKPS